MRAKQSLVNPGFTFDLFVCAAILVMNSTTISAGTDAASVYGSLNRFVIVAFVVVIFVLLMLL